MTAIAMSETLHIASDFSIPAEAVTQTFALLAMRGAGKSNAAVVMAEEMFRAGLHWVAIDPKGDWYGMRSSRDGKHAGLPVVIFGGSHGDVPLEPSAGSYIADLIIDQTLTCVLDLSDFTEGDKIRFLAGDGRNDGFAARFYRRKQPTQAPTHVFLEEADDYLPQRVDGRKAKLLHDCSRLLLWGRQRGIGGTAITQRSARLHKDLLTQTENLIVLRITAPQDQKAVHEWVKYHGIAEEMMKSLASLENGEAWLWSPHWLKKAQRVKFRRRETFDSGATPIVGEKQHVRPATLAEVDIASIVSKMADTIERAKADDPRELRRRIAELEKAAAASSVPPARDPKRESEIRKEAARAVHGVYQPIAQDMIGLAEGIRSRLDDLNAFWGERGFAVETAKSALTFEEALTEAPRPEIRRVELPAKMVVRIVAARAGAGRQESRRSTPPSSGTEGGLRRMLIALAQRPQGMTAKQLGVRAGLSSSSGTFGTYLGKGRTNGWIEGSRDRLVITKDGRASLGAYDPLPSGKALLDYWLGELGGGAARILQELARAYPKALDDQELGRRAELSASSGTFGTYLGKLRTLELVEGPRAQLRASEELFG